MRPRTYSAWTEATQGRGLLLGGTRRAGELQAPAVFAQAAIDVPAREAQIAAQMVDPCPLGGKSGPGCQRLRVGEIGEGAVQVIGDPLDRGSPDQRPASLRLARRRRQRDLMGGQGGRHPPEIVQQVALEAGQGVALGRFAGEP